MMQPIHTTWRDRFEHHPLVFGVGLLVAGFSSGFGVRPYIVPVAPAILSCTVEGLESLESGHLARVQTFGNQIIEAERIVSSKDAPAHQLQNSYGVAERLRGDVAEENDAYLQAIRLLERKCR